MTNFKDRRKFIKHSTALGLVGSSVMLQTFGSRSAEAADAGGYKALVCINLKGGMDHADTLIPFDGSSYNQLANARPELLKTHNFNDETSSRNRNNLLKLNIQNSAGMDSMGGREFGLPQELSELHAMFNEQDASIIANVGPIIQPTTRQNMMRVALPKRLFSHNDQQSTWQTLSTEGARFGWGGEFVTGYNRLNPTAELMFSALSTSSLDPYIAGRNIRPFRLPTAGKSLGLDIVDKGRLLGNDKRFNTARNMLRDYFETSDDFETNLLQRDVEGAMARGLENQKRYSGIQSSAPTISTVFPPTGLAQQLASVAEAISLREVIAAPRQVFYVTLGGFDTHSNQAIDLPAKHQEISMALAAFKKSMVELSAWNDVAVFTMSDFGRTLTDNGNGTDHGWGSHQFVMGGKVKGGRIFGQVPEPDPKANQYTENRARMIPTYSVEQYAAGLGRWFGLTDDLLFNQFQNLKNFDYQVMDLFDT